ncbi:Mitochondrial fission ELM1-like protein [Cynara cardunculus var. scolymus]|uniref:Mitochondrial fission ELM1-like protein n=1 Tax=Cynara cardunculus var. scolymus TaxID=59895 RepID=A0A103YFT1_CYNCS|nr:Mitochondrial fission ELM1-like protein [Cynara cardunculus var. scolymus]
MHRTVRRAVIIGNGFAGAENQCYGLIRALGLFNRHSFYRVRRPKDGISKWLNWLPVSTHKRLDQLKRQLYDRQFIFSGHGQKAAARLGELMPHSAVNAGADQSDIQEADAQLIATNASENFEKDGPLLVVASGRDTISVASSIKRLAPHHVFNIQIQHPRSHLNRFDLVISPCHDYYPLTPEGKKHIPWFLRMWITPRQPPGRNVVLTLAALHQVDSAAVQSAASAWHDELASLLRPLLVINIGGPIRHCRYGADLARELTASLINVLPTCGSVRISFSRRTPKQVSEIVVREFHNHPKVYIWDGEDPNPHMGHLAWADAFVITADSPVYVIGAERCTWKFAYFQKCLQERGIVRPFTGKENISETWIYPPLRDTAEAAEHVIEALAGRGWKLHT